MVLAVLVFLFGLSGCKPEDPRSALLKKRCEAAIRLKPEAMIVCLNPGSDGRVPCYRDAKVIRETLSMLEKSGHDPENGETADKTNRIWLRFPGQKGYSAFMTFGHYGDDIGPEVYQYLRVLLTRKPDSVESDGDFPVDGAGLWLPNVPHK